MQPVFPDYLSVSYDYGLSKVASLYFFRPSKVTEHATHGSMGASLKQNKRNLTLTLKVLLPSIVFHNRI